MNELTDQERASLSILRNSPGFPVLIGLVARSLEGFRDDLVNEPDETKVVRLQSLCHAATKFWGQLLKQINEECDAVGQKPKESQPTPELAEPDLVETIGML